MTLGCGRSAINGSNEVRARAVPSRDRGRRGGLAPWGDGDACWGARALSEEWIAYDLDVPFVDRSIAVHIDPETDRFTSTATRDNPSLRFIYTAGTVLMRHPSAEARCGTPWVEMPPEQTADATGAPLPMSPARPNRPRSTKGWPGRRSPSR
jgi:hypothetical protein